MLPPFEFPKEKPRSRKRKLLSAHINRVDRLGPFLGNIGEPIFKYIILLTGKTATAKELMKLLNVNSTFYDMFTSDCFWIRHCKGIIFSADINTQSMYKYYVRRCMTEQFNSVHRNLTDRVMHNHLELNTNVWSELKMKWASLMAQYARALQDAHNFDQLIVKLEKGHFQTFLTGETFLVENSVKRRMDIPRTSAGRSVFAMHVDAVDIFKTASEAAGELREVVKEGHPVPEYWFCPNVRSPYEFDDLERYKQDVFDLETLRKEKPEELYSWNLLYIKDNKHFYLNYETDPKTKPQSNLRL